MAFILQARNAIISMWHMGMGLATQAIAISGR